MSVEDRIRFLMRAAVRAEQEGAARAARALRRMAEDARPLEALAAGGSVLSFTGEPRE